MNVLPAWRKGYTGKGVVVSILDDGIEKNHPDLADNYVSRRYKEDITQNHTKHKKKLQLGPTSWIYTLSKVLTMVLWNQQIFQNR